MSHKEIILIFVLFRMDKVSGGGSGAWIRLSAADNWDKSLRFSTGALRASRLYRSWIRHFRKNRFWRLFDIVVDLIVGILNLEVISGCSTLGDSMGGILQIGHSIDFIDGRRVQIFESVFIIRNIGADNVWHSWGLAFSD